MYLQVLEQVFPLILGDYGSTLEVLHEDAVRAGRKLGVVWRDVGWRVARRGLQLAETKRSRDHSAFAWLLPCLPVWLGAYLLALVACFVRFVCFVFRVCLACLLVLLGCLLACLWMCWLVCVLVCLLAGLLAGWCDKARRCHAKRGAS